MSEPKESRGFNYWGTARLRLWFLGPLAITTIIIILSLSILRYQQEKGALQQGVVRIHGSAQTFYEESIRYDAEVLQVILHSPRHDAILKTALARRDRAALLMQNYTLKNLSVTLISRIFILPDQTGLTCCVCMPRCGMAIS